MATKTTWCFDKHGNKVSVSKPINVVRFINRTKDQLEESIDCFHDSDRNAVLIVPVKANESIQTGQAPANVIWRQ